MGRSWSHGVTEAEGGATREIRLRCRLVSFLPANVGGRRRDGRDGERKKEGREGRQHREISQRRSRCSRPATQPTPPVVARSVAVLDGDNCAKTREKNPLISILTVEGGTTVRRAPESQFEKSGKEDLTKVVIANFGSFGRNIRRHHNFRRLLT